jgi:hypothetical protein
MLPATNPNIIGVRKAPLLVADEPSTPWKKRGMKIVPANMANPVKKRATIEMLTMGFRKSSRGMKGSAARNSLLMKSTAITVAKTRVPITCAEPHGYSDPPQERANSSGTTASTRVATPR